MKSGYKECRVCGKAYKACHSAAPNVKGEFRWKEVACSPECGEIYLAQIIASRMATDTEADVEKDK